MNKQQSALTGFILVAILHLIGTVTHYPVIQTITKPLLVPLLILYYLFSVETYSKPLLIALVFCWLGDVALMLVGLNEIWFMLGLGCFLVGHVFFVLTYRQFRWEETDEAFQFGTSLRFSVLLLAPGTMLIILLYPTLGSLRFPVICYAIVITLMLQFAFFRFHRTTSISFWLVFAGALFFMVSDSLIAINKFMSPIGHSGLLVMFTYIAAQLLIVQGLIRHK